MTFCTTCGRERTGTSRFCTGCGTEFRDLAQSGHPATTIVDAEPAGPPYADGGSHRGGRVRRPPRRPDKVIVMAAAAVIVLGTAGGAYALVASQHHGRAAGLPTERASVAATQAAPASAAPTSAAPTSAAPSSAAPATSAPASPASPTASSGTVTVAAGAAGNQAAPQVTDLVNRYFTAINQHDYSAYVSLLDQSMQQQNSESSFDSGYGTTTDSAETLTGISDTGSGDLAASLTFTSHQNPADSPDNSSCDQWSITLFLVPDGGGYLITAPPSSYHASHQGC